MTTVTPQRTQEMLGDLAERAYALACRLSDDAMAAEDAEARGRLATHFQQVARAVILRSSSRRSPSGPASLSSVAKRSFGPWRSFCAARRG